MRPLYINDQLFDFYDETGAQDATDIFQRALDAMESYSTLRVVPGLAHISAPLTCLDKVSILECRGVTLAYYGETGTALTVGWSAGNKLAGSNVGEGHTIDGLKIRWKTGGGSGYFVNSAIGVMFQNTYAARGYALDLEGFGTGLMMRGIGTGCTYNRVDLRSVKNCRTSLYLYADQNGFVTESTFTGPGRLQHGDIAAGSNPVHVLCSQDPAGKEIGGIRFEGVSFEGLDKSCTVAQLNGGTNHCLFLGCRYESRPPHDLMPFNLGPTTYQNALIGNTCLNLAWNDKAPGKNGNLFLPNWH